jgi:NADH pyrophosphatase NudC (nudix superfamily)
MYCSKCGSEFPANAKFCPSCGREVSSVEQERSIKSSDVEVSATPPFLKALSIFVPTFLIVLVVNQLFYGGCFKAYCLSAAFPRIAIISAVITWALYNVFRDSETGK